MDDASSTISISPPRTDRVRQFAVAFWILILVASLGRAMAYHQPRHSGIYPVYAEAGQNWLAGKDVYAEHIGAASFPYSPLVAVMFAPFGVLPGPLGSALWRGLIVSIYAAALWRFARVAFTPSLDAHRRAWLFFLVVPLVGSTFLNGQAGALVASFVVLSLCDAADERWTRSALFAALAGSIKVYPLAVGLLIAAAYPKKFGVRFALAILACVAAPFLLQSPTYVIRQYTGWITLLQQASNHPWYWDAANYNLAFLMKTYATPLTPSAYRAVELIAAVVAASMVVTCRRAGVPHLRLIAIIGGLSACWMTLFGPGTEVFTYMLLAPTLAYHILAGNAGRPTKFLLGASWSLFAVAAMSVWFPFGSRIHAMGLQPIAASLLLACVVIDLVAALRAVSRGRFVPFVARLLRSITAKWITLDPVPKGRGSQSWRDVNG